MKKLIWIIYSITIHSETNQPLKFHNVNLEIIKENKVPEYQLIDEILILIIYNLKIDSELLLNQPIELNNVNPEITAETIYEHTVIDEVYDKETKLESNDESTTGLVEPEIKPEQDSQKPKTTNWIYVLCFICAIVIVICFVYGGKYFLNSKENSIVKIYINTKHNNYLVWNKGKKYFKSKDYYIYWILKYFVSYLKNQMNDQKIKKKKINQQKYDKMIEIDLQKINFNDSVIFGFRGDFHDIYFFSGKIENIRISFSDDFETHKQPIAGLNPNIETAEQLRKFLNYFEKKTMKAIEANKEALKEITDLTKFINTGLTFFPTINQVKDWPQKT